MMLQRRTVIVTQDLCAVCAVSRAAKLATACPVGAEVISLDPRTLGDVGADRAERSRLSARRRPTAATQIVAARCGATIDADRARSSVGIAVRARIFVAEWIDPPFSAGHWLPEMVELAARRSTSSAVAGQPSYATTWEQVIDERARARRRRHRAASTPTRLRQRARRPALFPCRGCGRRRGQLLLTPGTTARRRSPPAWSPSPPDGGSRPRPACDRTSTTSLAQGARRSPRRAPRQRLSQRATARLGFRA